MVPPDYHWEKVQRILEGDDMTDKEIIQTLRICATHIEKGCGLCPQMKYVRCTERLAGEAITMIERLTARGEMMKGTSNFDKLCHQVYNADGNGRDYIGKATGVACRLCKSPLYAYYCEERLYLVECKTCEMKALVKAENPQVAAYRAFGSEVK